MVMYESDSNQFGEPISVYSQTNIPELKQLLRDTFAEVKMVNMVTMCLLKENNYILIRGIQKLYFSLVKQVCVCKH
jgi:hypothetical protein